MDTSLFKLYTRHVTVISSADPFLSLRKMFLFCPSIGFIQNLFVFSITVQTEGINVVFSGSFR